MMAYQLWRRLLSQFALGNKDAMSCYFGLANAVATFCFLMVVVLIGMQWECVLCFIGDILFSTLEDFSLHLVKQITFHEFGTSSFRVFGRFKPVKRLLTSLFYSISITLKLTYTSGVFLRWLDFYQFKMEFQAFFRYFFFSGRWSKRFSKLKL